MKIEKEKIDINPNKSFKLFKPRLKNRFFWHYHSEYELVYVEAKNGIRHVGQHISNFIQSDLIFIGQNIPHLNFDYGIETEYKQIVLQLKNNFLGNCINEIPEIKLIEELFKKGQFGLSFYGKTKTQIVGILKEMENKDNLEQFFDTLRILVLLANSIECKILNKNDNSLKFLLNDKVRMGSIYNYIHLNYNKTPNVNEVANIVNLSTSAFCRYFKKQTNITFTDFVNQYRITQAKTMLLQGKNVSEIAYEVGFESLSYFTKLFKKNSKLKPLEFKKKHIK